MLNQSDETQKNNCPRAIKKNMDKVYLESCYQMYFSIFSKLLKTSIGTK